MKVERLLSIFDNDTERVKEEINIDHIYLEQFKKMFSPHQITGGKKPLVEERSPGYRQHWIPLYLSCMPTIFSLLDYAGVNQVIRDC